jgi:hypothetical protein
MLNRADNPATTLVDLSTFAQHTLLEPLTTYNAALDAILTLFANQDGIVQLADLPTIIIPDLHARRNLLIAILSTRLFSGPYTDHLIFDLLQQGLINVVCVGDIVHSEERSDWVINDDGQWTEELLEREMVRSLGAGLMIMYLKLAYPTRFHCLRGNHDDMSGELSADFRKFVGLRFVNDELVWEDGRPVITGEKGESKLAREWVLNREGFGESFLQRWSQFERFLPLFAQAPTFVVSHTLPREALIEGDIRNPSRPREVSMELTSRRGVDALAILETLTNLGIQDHITRWFYGHSQVLPEVNGGKYEENLDGLLVRLNSPKQHVFAYVPPSTADCPFDPTTDVFIKTPDEVIFHT